MTLAGKQPDPYWASGSSTRTVALWEVRSEPLGWLHNDLLNLGTSWKGTADISFREAEAKWRGSLHRSAVFDTLQSL